MALTLSNTLTNGTNADADEVQQNFADIVDKFAGNVDETDLKYPYSIVAWQFSAAGTSPSQALGGIADVLISGYRIPVAGSYIYTIDAGNDGENQIVNSVQKADRDYTAVSARCTVDLKGFTAGEILTFKIQTADDPTSTWTDIATATATVPNPSNTLASIFVDAVFAFTSYPIATSKWVRVLVVNPSTYTSPAGSSYPALPAVSGMIVLKTAQVA